MLLLCGILPLITKPTRVSDSSATIIDHILTNDLEHSSILGIVETNEISDHYPILCQSQVNTDSKKEDSTVTFYRDKSKFDSNPFNDKLHTFLNDFLSYYTC